jgi:hypothetical protein
MTPDEYPLVQAIIQRNPGLWLDTLSPDVVLYSPLLTRTFEGKKTAADLYSVIVEKFDQFEVTDFFEDRPQVAVFWKTRVDGRSVHGTDLIRYGADGLVTEVTAYMRPLSGIANFATSVGPGVAANQHPIKGSIARVITGPIRMLFALIDRFASMLT